MANYETLKAAIQNVVKTNGNNEITGALLQQSLMAMINSLGAGFQYVGIATPSTNPGTPDQNVFYVATMAGAYSNFGSINLNDGEVAILKYNGNWTKETTGIASLELLDDLTDQIKNCSYEIFGQRTDDYNVTGYNNLVGSYDFRSGKRYHFVLTSQYSGTLYFGILDKDGNTIRSTSAYTTYPVEFTLIPTSDYENAKLLIGGTGSVSCTVEITKEDSILSRLDLCEENISELNEKISTVVDELIISETINTAKVINLQAGNIYKVVISSFSGTNGSIILRSTTTSEYRIGPSFAVGTYYIPVFYDGNAPSIRIQATDFSLTYSLYRLPFKNFIDTNGRLMLNYVKAFSNVLTFTFGQGYYTNYKSLNGNASWCNSSIQFNRGRRIRLTFSSDYYVIFRHLQADNLAIYDGAQIISGTIYDTSNFAPWVIGIRRKNYAALTPDDVAAALTIEQIDGDVYDTTVGLASIIDLLGSTFDFTEDIAALKAGQQRNPRLGTLEIGRMVHHQNVESETSHIPSQSLLDIALAKFLGFKVIEANLHTCNDGVVVIKHGTGGALGAGLIFADGSGLSSETLFQNVSSVALRQNVTYNTYLEKNSGHIPTLDEFCAECARLNIIPFLRGCDNASLAIARKYLPDENIIIEGPAQRGDFRGIMTYYGTGTPAAILATCKTFGQPFYYCWSAIGSANDNEIANVIGLLHDNGFLIGGAYLSQNNYQRIVGYGLDINVSTFNNVPGFDGGNFLNIFNGGDSNIELTNSSFDATTKILSMAAGGSIVIPNSLFGNGLFKMCVKIRYVGNVDIRFGNTNDNNRDLVGYESDGSKSFVIANALYSSAQLRIIANASTQIYDLNVFVSKM